MHKPVGAMIASLIVCVAVVLAGCSAGSAGEPGGASPGSSAPVEVEENSATVDVNIARSLVDPDDSMSDEEIVSAAEDKGIRAVVDGDVVTYSMTNAQREEMVPQLRSAADQSIDEMTADDSNSVTDVEFSEDMTSFQVSVDSDRFAPIESLLALAFYIQGALYQQFAGVDPDDIDVVVDFVDDATGEVLQSGSYREMQENLKQ